MAPKNRTTPVCCRSILPLLPILFCCQSAAETEADFGAALLGRTCTIPLRLRLGAIDPRFHISEADVTKALNDAVEFWERATRRDLFENDSRNGFAVNLVYGERQELALAARQLKDYSSQSHEIVSKLKREFDTHRVRHEADADRYRRALQDLNRDVDEFNRAAARWDAAPGMESDRAALLVWQQRLETKQDALRTDLKSLQEQEAWLLSTQKSINEMAHQHNERIDETTRLLSSAPLAFAQLGLTEIQGDRTRIDIFQFADRRQLRVILAHELGHALGLGHSGDPQSIMYANWDGSATPVVMRADREQLHRRCGAQ